MDIPSALKLLRNAPIEALRIYKAEAALAFREIEQRLGGLSSPEDQTVCEDTLISRSNTSQSHSSTQATKSRAIDLLNALIKESPWVWATIKTEPNRFLPIKRKRTRDRRLRDIDRVDRDSKIENQEKLLRGLAQRSLALQGVRSGYLNVDEMCEKVKKGSLKGGRDGKTVLFVTNELDIEKEYQDLAIRATREGMKQLVTERFVGERLKETLQHTLQETLQGERNEILVEMLKGMLDAMEDSGSAPGISVFTALAVRPFRYLKYGELEAFAECLLGSGAMASSISMVANSDSDQPLIFVGHVIQTASNWLERVQIHYDECVTSEHREAQSKRLKHSHNAAPRNEQVMIQPREGAMPDPKYPSIPRNHEGLPTQSGSLYSSQTASVHHHGRWYNGQFAGSCGVSVVPCEGTSDRTWSEATDSLDERDSDESHEDTENPAGMNMRNAQNDVIWEPGHQGHSTNHIAFSVPDNQDLIAALDFPGAEANLFNSGNTMTLLTTALDADFLDAEFQLESTSFHLSHVNS